MPPDHLNGLGLTIELNLGLEMSGKVREFYVVWKVATLHAITSTNCMCVEGITVRSYPIEPDLLKQI